jgi:hypothetical protein
MFKMKKLKIFLLLFSILSGGQLFSQNAKEIALVIKVSGEAFIKSEKTDWQALQNGRRLHSGDFIKTGDAAMVAIVFTDDKRMVKIRSNTQVQLDGERDEKSIKKTLKMTLGQVWSKINPKGSGYKIVTPSGVAAVRGTEFYAIVDENGSTTIIGIEGRVELFNKLDSVLVSAGKTGFVEQDKAPKLTDTVGFQPWADSEDTADTLEIEFQDADGNIKKLKLKY